MNSLTFIFISYLVYLSFLFESEQCIINILIQMVYANFYTQNVYFIFCTTYAFRKKYIRQSYYSLELISCTFSQKYNKFLIKKQRILDWTCLLAILWKELACTNKKNCYHHVSWISCLITHPKQHFWKGKMMIKHFS